MNNLNSTITFAIYVCMFAHIGCNQKLEQKLPIYGQRSLAKKEISGRIIIDTVYHTIPEFSFINQDSLLISHNFFNQKIYVANFFFTRCPTICPTMQRNMFTVYEKYKHDERVAFLSHSIDCRNDHPRVLKEYADRLGVDNSQWQFVNGQKNEVFDIAKEYLVFTTEDENAPGGYDHQGLFLLVDQKRRIRGAYDGTEDDQISKLLNDMKTLLKEHE